MTPTHSAAAPPEAASRRDRVLGSLVCALSPTHGARRNAAAALQTLVSTAPERRAAATRTVAGPQVRHTGGSVRGAGWADRAAAAGQPR